MRGAHASRLKRQPLEHNKLSKMSKQDLDKPDIDNMCTDGRVISKRLSRSNLTDTSDKGTGNIMNVARLNALRNSINEHHSIISKMLLSSKELADKRSQIDAAFRICKEAFFDLSSACIVLLEN